jgi:hypothetical protein
MDFERIAGVMSQAVLGAVWFIVVALTARVYLRIATPEKSMTNPSLNADEKRVKTSFAAFALAFMPALAAWLPAFGCLPSTDQLFIPAILTWLVLLVFGTLQFHLNLIPARAALMAVVSMEGGDLIGATAHSQATSAAQRRRNV